MMIRWFLRGEKGVPEMGCIGGLPPCLLNFGQFDSIEQRGSLPGRSFQTSSVHDG